MIIIKTVIKYVKLIGIFILLELFFSFIIGFLRLIGLSSSISNLILLLINLAIFFIFGFIFGKITNTKGLIEGAKIGSILVAALFIISLVFFTKNLSFATLFYYLALIFITMLGSTIGKNKKEEVIQDKK